MATIVCDSSALREPTTDSEALVQLALNRLSCSQKELAAHLGVSPTQISQWKKGERMSRDMEERLRNIAEIGDGQPLFVLWAGSLEDAIKWERLIHHLAESALFDAETGYDTDPLNDEMGLLCWETFNVLREMGVAIPPKFPKELDVDYDAKFGGDDAQSLEEEDALSSILNKNPYSSAISKIYHSLNDVYGFYAAYVSDLMNDDDLEIAETGAENIEPCLMPLAATKIDVDPSLATAFREFKYKVTEDFAMWLNIVKEKASRAGVPLRAELLNMVHGSHDEIGHEAEAESLGLNSARLHLDIYMNELLCGMRAIHQVLPKITKKLGIKKAFTLDTSEFYIR